MALTTPILYTQVAFDASKDQAFKFNVIGGDQVTGATITIKDNASLVTAYTGTSTSFAYSITVPAGSLVNGHYYQASIVTHNAAGESSQPSNTIQFYCYSTPSFEFSNLPSTHIINNASYVFDVTYNQTEGETLNAYRFDLFDNTGVLLSTSGSKYVSSGGLPLTVSYTFSGFEDKTVYGIQCTGTTVNGTLVDTSVVTISVQYETARGYSYLYLTNNCEDGNITVESNVVGINGSSYPNPPTYLADKLVDLTANGSYVKWTEGYQLPNDYTMKIWGQAFKANIDQTKELANIVSLANSSGDIVSISYWEDTTKAWYQMRVQDVNETYAYVIKSPTIDKPTQAETLFLWIRCVGGLYDLKIENLGADWDSEVVTA
nr:MAG TPA: hypothetical protein [Caudoviricetes sp.]